MNLALESDHSSEKIAFIIFGDINPAVDLNKKVSELIGRFCVGPSDNLDFDIVRASDQKTSDGGLLEVNMVKSSALNAAQALTSAVRIFNQYQESKKYTTAVLIHSKFFNDSNFPKLNLVLDFSLPKNYLYIAYDVDLDFGYSVDWLWGSPELISVFDNFSDVVTNCLDARNNYLEMFTRTGWPSTANTSSYSNAIRSSLILIDNILAHPMTERIFSLFGSYASRKYRGVKKIIARQLISSERIAEIHGEMMNKPAQSRYDRDLAWNLRPLVKYFVYIRGLRDHVRFLSIDDFKFTASSEA